MGASADNPVTGMKSMTEGFTNECNYGGKISYMKNLTGLWILQCLKDEWKASFPQMEAEAQQAESLSAFIDTDDPAFAKPDAMEGKHDDLLFSDMIAQATRWQQQVEKVQPKKLEGFFTDTELEDLGYKNINIKVKLNNSIRARRR